MTVLGIPPEAQLPTPKMKKVRVIRSSCAPSPYRPQIHKLMGIWSVLDGYRYKFAKLDVKNLSIFLRKVCLEDVWESKTSITTRKSCQKDLVTSILGLRNVMMGRRHGCGGGMSSPFKFMPPIPGN